MLHSPPWRAACAALTTILFTACAASDHAGSREALSVCPPDAIGSPAEFVWTHHPAGGGNAEEYWSGTLEIGEATFTIGGETLTTRAYRQAGGAFGIPGPTIRMTPGRKYVLSFHNTLPYEAATGEHNVFKDPNVSNVHTHGLHISGESPSDDVTRSFEGGFGGDFVWDIPADHMGGTYWYHAHHHGSTYLQVSGGAFGMIVIDDSNDGLPANVAAMTERELVVAYLDPGVAGTGGDTLMSGTLSPTWTVNGVVGGTMCAPANEWQHWRLLLADRNASPKTVSVGAGCEVALLARDGVWRTEAPKALPTSSISLTGASRADLAVRCASDSSIMVNNGVVATVAVTSVGSTAPHPYAADGVSTWSADRPAYLRDLRGVPNNQINSESVRMGARTVNGSKFDHANPTFRLSADKVQDWSINGAGQHPFHLHVYHMQTSGCGGDYEDGEYYDVVASSCSVRFDLNAATTSAYEGTTIMHCHILEHEDQGAMGWLDVVGGQPAPTFPNDGNAVFGEYYELQTGPAPYCGDATCDASEDTCSCPGDCGAAPTTETVCSGGGDEDCDGLVDCDDPDCGGAAACQTSFCGDGTCDPGEAGCGICEVDCIPPATETSCGNGSDDDCDGAADCADSDCAGDPACACDNDNACEAGEDCNNCPNDCAGVLGGRPSNRYCCGDGVRQSAETSAICDGNY